MSVLAFLFLFKIQDIYPQQEKYEFEKIVTSKENYPQGIHCMIKDNTGFMWFGTNYGLYRFDGYNFKLYSFQLGDSTSLSNNYVSSICDDGNFLWVGTYGGLNRFNKTTEQFKRFKYEYKSDFIYSMCTSKNNELWIGTVNGFHKFIRGENKFVKYENNPEDTLGLIFNKPVNELYEDDNGYLWIGTLDGLQRYDIKNKLFKNYSFDSTDLSSISGNAIQTILDDGRGSLWIATYSNGLNHYNKTTEKFHRYQHDSLNSNSIIDDHIVSMTKDADDNLFIATIKGISIYDIYENKFTNLSKHANPSLSEISYIYYDTHCIIWICTSGETSFSLFNQHKWKFNHYKNIPDNNKSLTYNNVFTICEDSKGNLWVGNGGGIDILNYQKEKIQRLQNNPEDSTSLSSGVIWSMCKDKRGNMWVGMRDGPLNIYNSENNRFSHLYDFDGKVFSPYSIFEDKEENLWVGLFEGGIRVYDKNTVLIKKYLSLKNDSSDSEPVPVYDFFEDIKGNLWAGSAAGLASIDLKTDKITLYEGDTNDSGSQSLKNVLAINEDGKGNLWLATDIGLNNFDINSKTSSNYRNLKGRGTDFFIGLLKDKNGNFWGSSDRGIVMFKIKERTFTNFGLSDGLQGLSFALTSHFKSKEGEMFFGGSNGLNSFYPDSIPQNNNIPAIVLTDFKIFNKEVKLDTSVTEKKIITISYKENFFSFDYAALDYTNPEKNQHAYMLEGIDKDWNNVGNIRTANYTNIEPGEYTFKVKGSNNDGVWNEKGASVRLIITPPWYKAIWVKGLMAILLMGGIGFIFSQRIKKVYKEKKLQEEFTKNLIESQEDVRKKIAAELHDSLGQELLIIKNKALISIKKTNEVEKFREQMNEISELTSSTIEEVRVISYALRPYELDRLGLTQAIISLIVRANASTDIQFTNDIENIDNAFSQEIEINIYRIIQECFNNVIKHSEAAKVFVNVKKHEREIEIVISDNGKGFDIGKNDMNSQRKGLGLRGIPERVKLFGGEFNIESETGKGTRIKIIMPV